MFQNKINKIKMFHDIALIAILFFVVINLINSEANNAKSNRNITNQPKCNSTISISKEYIFETKGSSIIFNFFYINNKKDNNENINDNNNIQIIKKQPKQQPHPQQQQVIIVQNINNTNIIKNNNNKELGSIFIESVFVSGSSGLLKSKMTDIQIEHSSSAMQLETTLEIKEKRMGTFKKNILKIPLAFVQMIAISIALICLLIP